jgi:hypothetical protein
MRAINYPLSSRCRARHRPIFLIRLIVRFHANARKKWPRPTFFHGGSAHRGARGLQCTQGRGPDRRPRPSRHRSRPRDLGRFAGRARPHSGIVCTRPRREVIQATPQDGWTHSCPSDAQEISAGRRQILIRGEDVHRQSEITTSTPRAQLCPVVLPLDRDPQDAPGP